MNGGIINSVTRLHLVGCFHWIRQMYFVLKKTVINYLTDTFGSSYCISSTTGSVTLSYFIQIIYTRINRLRYGNNALHSYFTSLYWNRGNWAPVTVPWYVLSRWRMVFNVGGSCEYIEQAVADPGQGVILQLRFWARWNKSSASKLATLQNTVQGLRLGGMGNMDWIDLALDTDRLMALVNEVMNFRGSIKCAECLVGLGPVYLPGRTLLHRIV